MLFIWNHASIYHYDKTPIYCDFSRLKNGYIQLKIFDIFTILLKKWIVGTLGGSNEYPRSMF